MTTITLIDSRTVDSASPEWRAECLARHEHVQKLLAMRGADGRAKRNAYIEQVAFLEGAEAAKRLRDRLAAEWPKADKP